MLSCEGFAERDMDGWEVSNGMALNSFHLIPLIALKYKINGTLQ
jgi:hypothetical protein